jgi:integrase
MIRRNKEVSRDRFLQSDEFTAFCTALSEEPNHTIRDYIWISLFTGARRDNVLSMKWTEVNLIEGTWRIPMTKNGTPQIIPLPAPAIDLLQERRTLFDKTEVFIFPGSGLTGHLVEPKKAWAKILQRANIADLRLHDLRRTMGSWQAKTGASLVVIGKSLNQKSTQTTAIYARLDMDPVRASMNTATNAMLKAGGIIKSAPAKKTMRYRMIGRNIAKQ